MQLELRQLQHLFASSPLPSAYSAPLFFWLSPRLSASSSHSWGPPRAAGGGLLGVSDSFLLDQQQTSH